MSDRNEKDRESGLPVDDPESDVARTFDPNRTLASGSYSSAKATSSNTAQDDDTKEDKPVPTGSGGSDHESTPDNLATVAPSSDLTAGKSVGLTRPGARPVADSANESLAIDDSLDVSESVDATKDISQQVDPHEEFLTATNAGQMPEQRIGRYEVKRMLGEGAFGKVFEARDPQLDRVVALKVAKSVVGETQLQRFTREARAAAQLRHPHIIPVYEYGQIEGQSYIVYEFVEGETLAFKSKRLGQLTFDSVVDIVREIAEGLDYAHEQGIIHRDMKPDNVMIDPKGGIHIADFGCALRDNDRTDTTRAGPMLGTQKHISPDQASGESSISGERLTREGAILGTPVYMSPEQASGKSSTADGRTDIWSLGVVFYELLSGERPFDGSLAELLHWICNNDPKPLRKIDPKIPIDLETICNKCLNRDLDERFLTAGELAAELTRFQQGEPIKSRRIGPVQRSWMWAKRNRTVASLITAVVTVLLLGTIISSLYANWLIQEQNKHVQTQLSLLKQSQPSALPGIFDSLAEFQQGDDITKRLDEELGHDEKLDHLSDQVDSATQRDVEQKRVRIKMALLEIEKAEENPDLSVTAKGLLSDLLKQNREPEFFQVCCDVLDFQKDQLKGQLWEKVGDKSRTKQERFCAAVALANYDPESENWERGGNTLNLSTDLANELTSMNQIEMARWLPSVEKVRDKLKAPLLNSFKDALPGQEIEANRAAVALSRLYKDKPEWLVEKLLPSATPIQVSYIVDSLRENHELAVRRIRNWLRDETIRGEGNPLGDWGASVSSQANMAVALIELDPDYQWEHLAWGEDPSLAAEIIERIAPASTPFEILLERLKTWNPGDGNNKEDELSGVLLALGEFRQNQITVGHKQELKPVLLKLFKQHPSARVHSSSKWLMKRIGARLHWAKDIEYAEKELERELPDDDKSWHVDLLGNTFIVFDPVRKFQKGLDFNSSETATRFWDSQGELPQHLIDIPRRFGICTTEVTVGEFEQFEEYLIEELPKWVGQLQKVIPELKERQRAAKTPNPEVEKKIKTYGFLVRQFPATLKTIKGKNLERAGKNKQLPVSNVDFLMALAYCSWVNKQEDAGSCLPGVNVLMKSRAFQRGEEFGFADKKLDVIGYRLPTATEWEYACRGKTRTSYPFGRSEHLLRKYAWYGLSVDDANAQPVEQLKPLSTGGFDMLGNVSEWCLDYYLDSLPELKAALEFGTTPTYEDHGPEFFKAKMESNGLRLSIGPGTSREIRGGSYVNKLTDVRPTKRQHQSAITGFKHLGFRLARTYPPKTTE